jgi:hypothetical protein
MPRLPVPASLPGLTVGPPQPLQNGALPQHPLSRSAGAAVGGAVRRGQPQCPPQMSATVREARCSAYLGSFSEEQQPVRPGSTALPAGGEPARGSLWACPKKQRGIAGAATEAYGSSWWWSGSGATARMQWSGGERLEPPSPSSAAEHDYLQRACFHPCSPWRLHERSRAGILFVLQGSPLAAGRKILSIDPAHIRPALLAFQRLQGPTEHSRRLPPSRPRSAGSRPHQDRQEGL